MFKIQPRIRKIIRLICGIISDEITPALSKLIRYPLIVFPAITNYDPWFPVNTLIVFRYTIITVSPRDEIIAATKKYIVEAIENNDMTLIAIEVDKTLMDHVHVFVSIPPRMSASQAVNIMKGYSSRHLRRQFDWLKKLHDKPKLWASSYYWGTTGNVSAQAVKRYIEECQGWFVNYFIDFLLTLLRRGVLYPRLPLRYRRGFTTRSINSRRVSIRLDNIYLFSWLVFKTLHGSYASRLLQAVIEAQKSFSPVKIIRIISSLHKRAKNWFTWCECWKASYHINL